MSAVANVNKKSSCDIFWTTNNCGETGNAFIFGLTDEANARPRKPNMTYPSKHVQKSNNSVGAPLIDTKTKRNNPSKETNKKRDLPRYANKTSSNSPHLIQATTKPPSKHTHNKQSIVEKMTKISKGQSIIEKTNKNYKEQKHHDELVTSLPDSKASIHPVHMSTNSTLSQLQFLLENPTGLNLLTKPHKTTTQSFEMTTEAEYPAYQTNTLTPIFEYQNEDEFIRNRLSTTEDPHSNMASNVAQKVALKDLCTEDKKRVANLIKELAKVGSEKESAQKDYEERKLVQEKEICDLLQRQERVLKERDEVQQHLFECQDLLTQYQQRLDGQPTRLVQSMCQQTSALYDPHNNQSVKSSQNISLPIASALNTIKPHENLVKTEEYLTKNDPRSTKHIPQITDNFIHQPTQQLQSQISVPVGNLVNLRSTPLGEPILSSTQKSILANSRDFNTRPFSDKIYKMNAEEMEYFEGGKKNTIANNGQYHFGGVYNNGMVGSNGDKLVGNGHRLLNVAAQAVEKENDNYQQSGNTNQNQPIDLRVQNRGVYHKNQNKVGFIEYSENSEPEELHSPPQPINFEFSDKRFVEYYRKLDPEKRKLELLRQRADLEKERNRLQRVLNDQTTIWQHKRDLLHQQQVTQTKRMAYFERNGRFPQNVTSNDVKGNNKNCKINPDSETLSDGVGRNTAFDRNPKKNVIVKDDYYSSPSDPPFSFSTPREVITSTMQSSTPREVITTTMQSSTPREVITSTMQSSTPREIISSSQSTPVNHAVCSDSRELNDCRESSGFVFTPAKRENIDKFVDVSPLKDISEILANSSIIAGSPELVDKPNKIDTNCDDVITKTASKSQVFQKKPNKTNSRSTVVTKTVRNKGRLSTGRIESDTESAETSENAKDHRCEKAPTDMHDRLQNLSLVEIIQAMEKPKARKLTHTHDKNGGVFYVDEFIDDCGDVKESEDRILDDIFFVQ